MITINYTIYERTQYSAIPKTIQITVDENLAEVLQIITGRNYESNFAKDDSTWLYRQDGAMSKDSGFNYVSIRRCKTGQDAGLFYGGPGRGQQYLDLKAIRDGGTYYFSDLVKTT